MSARRLAFFVAAATVCWTIASADTIQVDLSNLVNADLTTYTGGSNYPQHGGDLTIGTIPFLLATFGPNLDTGIIQTNGVQTFSISTDVFGVSYAYVVVNSAWGSCGSDIGEIDFLGSSHTFSYKLTEGSNVRDHFNGQFCNSAPDVAATAAFGPGGSDRLDMQLITLPSDFANDTLQSIEFLGYGAGQNGAPFLAAATLVTDSDSWIESDPSPVPEPSTYFALCAVTVAMLAARRFAARYTS